MGSLIEGLMGCKVQYAADHRWMASAYQGPPISKENGAAFLFSWVPAHCAPISVVRSPNSGVDLPISPPISCSWSKIDPPEFIMLPTPASNAWAQPCCGWVRFLPRWCAPAPLPAGLPKIRPRTPQSRTRLRRWHHTRPQSSSPCCRRTGVQKARRTRESATDMRCS